MALKIETQMSFSVQLSPKEIKIEWPNSCGMYYTDFGTVRFSFTNVTGTLDSVDFRLEISAIKP